MFWRIILLFLAYQQMSLTRRISTIKNAIFDPIDGTYLLANLSNILTRDLCICACYTTTTTNCITANYYGSRRQCVLFSIPLSLDQLRQSNSSENTTVISFQIKNNTEITTTGYSNTFVSSPTTIITTQPTTTTLTPASRSTCNAATSYIIGYTTLPTTYQKQTYIYTALSTGSVTLEFGFQAKNSAKTWHLDDVSIIDINASNSEMLINGNFENSSLIGWQVLCSTENCGTSGGAIVQSSCHAGSYCYEGTCRGAYDFLRQTFIVSVGHVYTLSFWLYTDGHSQQAAYVNIS